VTWSGGLVVVAVPLEAGVLETTGALVVVVYGFALVVLDVNAALTPTDVEDEVTLALTDAKAEEVEGADVGAAVCETRTSVRL
jgi:hypothetical protein